MTVQAAIGLLLMFYALLVVMRASRAPRISYAGVVFVVGAFIFHFVGEVAQWLLPGYDPFRAYVSQAEIDRWVVWAGTAMLCFALVYSLRLARLRQAGGATPSISTRWPDWRPFALVTTPMWLFAVGAARVTGQDASYWAGGLVGQFLILLIPLTLFLYLRQAPGRRVLPTMLLTAVAMTLIGSRSFVAYPLVMMGWGLAISGTPVRRRQWVALIGVLLALALVLSAARIVVGRDVLSKGLTTERVTGMVAGLSSLGAADVRDSLAEDYIYRIDGNAWPAIVLARQETSGTMPLSTLRHDITVAIPSFLYTSKIGQAVATRDEEARIDQRYNIPSETVTVQGGPDWLPTFLGTTLAYTGPIGMCVFAALLGWLLALFDTRMHTRVSFLSLLIGMGLVQCAATTEQGFQDLVTTMRGVLLIAFVWSVVTWLSRRRGSRRDAAAIDVRSRRPSVPSLFIRP